MKEQSELHGITELVIYRDIWKRGLGGTELLNRRGMCCLGFLCEATGTPVKKLLEVSHPLEVPRAALHVSVLASRILGRAVTFNDAEVYGDNREAHLTTLFATEDIALTFEDVAPDDFRAKYEGALPC